MYRFFDRFGKKLLAVFGVALMIVFVLPTTALDGSGSGGDRVVGRVTPVGGGDRYAISAQDVADAAVQLQLLQSVYVSPFAGAAPGEQPQAVPLASALLGPNVLRGLNDEPATYRLLLDEAARRGVAVPDTTVDQILAGALATPPGNTRAEPVPLELLADRPRNAIRTATSNLLLTLLAFREAGDVVKISQPLVDRTLAREFQKLDLSLVEFRADDYADRVTEPTDGQVQALFDARRADAPGGPTADNPLGLGYRVPDRVKYQYVALPPGEVRRAVEASRTPFELEVEATKYYQQHRGEFAAPATTQPITQPAGAATPGEPLPFEQVRGRAVDRVLAPEVDRVRSAVLAEVRQALSASADPSFAVLETLKAEVAQKYGVDLTVASRADAFQSSADLRAEPGIGESAAILTGPGGGMSIRPFADHALAFDDTPTPTAGTVTAAGSDKLTVLRPSEPLQGRDGTEYVFRVAAADPAHPADDLAAVRDRVVADARRIAAYELARADAEAFVALARESGVRSVAGSGDYAGKSVVRTGPFDAQTFSDAAYPVPAESRRTFLDEAYALLALPADLAHPVGPIALPAAGRVLAAQAEDVIPAWSTEAERQQLASRVADALRRQLTTTGTLDPPPAPTGFDPLTGRPTGPTEPTLVERWFAPAAVAERVGYAPADRPAPATTDAPTRAPGPNPTAPAPS